MLNANHTPAAFKTDEVPQSSAVSCMQKKIHVSTQDQGDKKDYTEPPAPRSDQVKLVHHDETDFYVLPFSLYALGIR